MLLYTYANVYHVNIWLANGVFVFLGVADSISGRKEL